MNMDSQGNRPYPFKAAARFAFTGIAFAFKTERNIRIHFMAAAIVLVFAYILSAAMIEWIILILVIAINIALELINTAIENVVDLVTLKKHPLAKAAKDIAAGAVLIFSIASVIIGLCIFIPLIIERFHV